MKINNKICIMIIGLMGFIASFFKEPDWGSLIFFLIFLIGMEICDLTSTMKEGIISHIIKYTIDENKKENITDKGTDTPENL